MPTTTLAPELQALAPELQTLVRETRESAETLYDSTTEYFRPALDAGIADSRPEYLLESRFVSDRRLAELQIRAMRKLVGVEKVRYSTRSNYPILLRKLREDPSLGEVFKQASGLVEEALEPLRVQWSEDYESQLRAARRAFAADWRNWPAFAGSLEGTEAVA